jgi:hypothetical protein
VLHAETVQADNRRTVIRLRSIFYKNSEATAKPSIFINAEFWNMHFVYGFYDGNSLVILSINIDIQNGENITNMCLKGCYHNLRETDRLTPYPHLGCLRYNMQDEEDVLDINMLTH